MTPTITSVVGVLLLAALVCGLPQNPPPFPQDVFDVMNKAAGTCGVANTDRIVGGSEVSPKNKYPWYVGLGNWNSYGYYCGGTIISEEYVVTAAHCFFDSNGNRVSDDGLVVGVADHDQYDYNDDNAATELVDVVQVTLHPNYSPSGYDNDIALLKLNKKLDFTQKELQPVCLPADDSKTYVGQTGYAYGWGALEYDKNSPAKLQEVDLPIIETKDNRCFNLGGITENMLCAGYKEGGKDTCQGDSGGPLTVIENGKHTLVGIVSYGYKCAEPNSPGVYARVTKFLSWITQTTA